MMYLKKEKKKVESGSGSGICYILLMKLVYVHRPENILGEWAYSHPQALKGLGQNALYLNRTHDFLITAQCNRAQRTHGCPNWCAVIAHQCYGSEVNPWSVAHLRISTHHRHRHHPATYRQTEFPEEPQPCGGKTVWKELCPMDDWCRLRNIHVRRQGGPDSSLKMSSMDIFAGMWAPIFLCPLAQILPCPQWVRNCPQVNEWFHWLLESCGEGQRHTCQCYS